VTWKTALDQVLRQYNYQYDGLNRLKKGIYSEPGASVPQNGFFNETLAYDLNGNMTSLQRNGKSSSGTAQLIDDLTYNYTGNKLNTVTDTSGNYSGYPDTSGAIISYDDNGNMTDHKDKGILQIYYNHLDLPNYLKFDKGLSTRTGMINENTSYTYRADGTKLKKIYNYTPPIVDPLGTTTTLLTQITEYVDGFQYETPAGKKGGTNLILKFVPTAEGYYNFENNKYIYSYTDHLGNIRLSYSKSLNGSAEVLEENNYYAFGLKHEGYNALAGNPAYSYGYNGKELQKETGWGDYGARMYMSDIGRWGVIDPLAEQMRRYSPYNFAFNNPVSFIDPDGMAPRQFAMAGDGFGNVDVSSGWTNPNWLGLGDRGGSYDQLASVGGGGGLIYQTDEGTVYTGSAATNAFSSLMSGNNNPPRPSFWNRVGSFFKGIFGGNEKGAGITSIAAGAQVSRLGRIVQIGEIIEVNAQVFYGAAGTLATRSLWGLPLMLNGDTQFAANSKGIDIPITTTDNNPERTITLFRGVSSKAKGSMYFEAMQGIAIPNGFRQIATTWGPHSDMELHAGGDNLSIWTSWSTSEEVARDFATGNAFYENGIPGIIMSKTFRVGEAVPNPFTHAEAEWLVPGVTYGAKVKYVLPRSK
jgi:RHS repeat-associated protein